MVLLGAECVSDYYKRQTRRNTQEKKFSVQNYFGLVSKSVCVL